MAKKKQKAEQELRADLKKLRAQLAAAEKSAEKWKAKAKDHRSVAAGAKAELSGVRRSLEKAEASATRWKDRVKTPEPAPAAAPSFDGWNVTRLRAEARSRGVAGYSRKTREQLLAELRG